MPSRRLLVCCVFAVLASMQALAQTFVSAVPYPSGAYGPNAVAMADVNGDGKPDLVVANWCTDVNCTASSVGVLMGNGDGTFQTAVAYPSGGLYADSVAVADLRGNGKLDIVVGNCGFPKITTCDLATQGNVAVLLGNGDGTFQAAVPYSLGTNIGATSVAVADLGNGTLDLIVAAGSATGSKVDVLLGNGDGTFKSAVTYDSGGFTALSVAVADVNGDGKPDVVVANWCPDSACTATSTVGVLLGNGDGTLQPVVTYPSGGFNTNSVVIGDVNGDGKFDLVVANGSATGVDAGNVSVLLGNGDGTFQTAVPYSRGGYGASSVVLMDVNGDGKPDVVVSNCSTSAIGCASADGDVAVLLGKGNGTFQSPTSYGSGGSTPFGVAVGDFNGDGKPDIVAANCVSNQCGTGLGAVGVLINTTLTATTTALTSSANPSQFEQAVTFTATVTGRPSFGETTPTGTVNFLDGATSIGTSPLNGSGVAILTTSTLPVGTNSITASYSGDTDFAPSTSPALQQLVQGANYTLSANPTSVPVNPGSAANYVITLTPSAGYDGAVTISCPTSLPSGVTCNTPSIAPGKTQATLTVSTTGPSAALISAPDVNSLRGASNLWASLSGFGLVGLILAGDWKKRNRRSIGIALAIFAVAMILALVGCGGGSKSGSGAGGGGGTPAGTYQLQLTGTGTAGTNQGSTAPHPLTVTLVVN
jgi:Bacterial Ig-like domain (group 3)/FG-GAP-like repeat